MSAEGTPEAPPGGGEAPGALPEGLRVYAIGDIHGRFDLLTALAADIAKDLEASPPQKSVEIFLGDYIDRGPSTREVVDWLIETPPLADERICLMGNHEDLLLKVLDDGEAMSNWIFNGGSETIVSYLSGTVRRRDFDTTEALRLAFLEALPEGHRSFYRSLKRMISYGGYLFVHAGLRPGTPIEKQDPEDLIWIREPFLNSSADFGTIVVHGHTPVTEPEVKPNRINIDTGAVFSNRLTALVLEGTERRFLNTPGR